MIMCHSVTFCDIRNCDEVRNLNFSYMTEDQFNSKFGSHVNIRSLNSNCARLYQYLQLLAVGFDVIVWSYVSNCRYLGIVIDNELQWTVSE